MGGWMGFSSRTQHIVKTAMFVMDCHNQCTRHPSKFGSADWAKVGAIAIDDLGGLVKKISQFLTQDAAATPDPEARRHFRMLLGAGQPRSMAEIRLQIDPLFDATEMVNSVELLGVGCAAEVSMVQAGSETWAVKTVNPTSEAKFHYDVEMLRSFTELVNTWLVPVAKQLCDGATVDHMMVIVDRVGVLAKDAALIASQERQFDLTGSKQHNRGHVQVDVDPFGRICAISHQSPEVLDEDACHFRPASRFFSFQTVSRVSPSSCPGFCLDVAKWFRPHGLAPGEHSHGVSI